MEKTIRKLRIGNDIWKKVEKRAKHEGLTPNQYAVMLIARSVNGKKPKEEPARYIPDEVPVETGISPLIGDLGPIRALQAELAQAEEEYAGYKRGVAPEDWEEEQKSDYVIDCVDRMETARSQLKQLLPEVEDGKS